MFFDRKDNAGKIGIDIPAGAPLRNFRRPAAEVSSGRALPDESDNPV